MHYLSRLLERVASVLFGPYETDRPAHSADSGYDDLRPVHYPSAAMWGAILAGARRRRAPHLWSPSEPLAYTDDPSAGALVSTYVLTPEERQQALSARQFTGASR